MKKSTVYNGTSQKRETLIKKLTILKDNLNSIDILKSNIKNRDILNNIEVLQKN
ncbi:MAG: hypothetical protein AB8U25_02725 [Rickettsiales endosymbiont of Dermacentor nuttalli]